MCLSCGCCLPNDDHGNMANITMTKLLKAMVAGKVSSPRQTIQNMMDCYSQIMDAKTTDIPDRDDDDYQQGGSTYDATGKLLDVDKGDGPGTVPNDPNYLKNNLQVVNRPGGM